SSDSNDIFSGHNTHQPYFENISQDVGDVVQVGWIGCIVHIERLDGQALVLSAHLLIVVRNDYSIARKRRPECLGNFPGKMHRAVKVQIVYVKTHTLAGKRLVICHRDAECSSNCLIQVSRFAAYMKILLAGLGTCAYVLY